MILIKMILVDLMIFLSRGTEGQYHYVKQVIYLRHICPKWRSFAVFQKEELNNDGYIDVLPVDSELEID